MKHFLLTLLVALTIAIPCLGNGLGRSCSKCGCCEIKKVCRLVPDVKKVPEIKYVVEQEEVCLLGKSCTEDRMVPDECSPTGQRCEAVQVPRCGRIVCKKKLKKTTTTVEKPSAKCVLEMVCCQCGCVCESGTCTP